MYLPDGVRNVKQIKIPKFLILFFFLSSLAAFYFLSWAFIDYHNLKTEYPERAQLSKENQILSPCASMHVTANSYGKNISARIPAVFHVTTWLRLPRLPMVSTSFSFTAAATWSASTMKETNCGRATSKKNSATWH